MANTNSPYGFKPYRHRLGGTIRPSSYRLASAAAGNIFCGDPVKAQSDGTIIVAAAGDRILGVFGGCYWVDPDGTPRFMRYWPTGTVTQASVAAKAYIYDDPGIIYRVQSAGTPTVTNIFNLADHVASAGSTMTGTSGMTLSGTMATAAASWRILDFIQEPDNEIGQYADLEVQPFEFELVEHSQATPGV